MSVTQTQTRADAARRSRTGVRGLSALVRAELVLFLRDPGNVFFVVAFPAVLLVGMGFAIPNMTEPIPDLGPPWTGLAAIHLFAPIISCIAAATGGLTTLPAYLAGYRETGVMRRMSTTPMRPQGVLGAQVVVQFCGVVVGTILALVIAALVFGNPNPEQPVLAVVTFCLTVTSMFGLGLIIGGLAPKASTASGLGMLLYFPMLFLAGLWTPGPLMPAGVAAVATYTPLGSASQAMTTAWFDSGTPWLQLGVMAGWSVVLFVIAVKTFRWSR